MTENKPLPVVVNVRKKHLLRVYGPEVDTFVKWCGRPDSVYVGRRVQYVHGTFDSVWGNYQCLDYDGYLNSALTAKNHLIPKLAGLAGKELGCWCVDPGEPDKYCHGHAIVTLYKAHVLNGLTVEEMLKELL